MCVIFMVEEQSIEICVLRVFVSVAVYYIFRYIAERGLFFRLDISSFGRTYVYILVYLVCALFGYITPNKKLN